MSVFYITTPIYYVNDKPHIGHAYTTILADVLSRYHRSFGDDVFFLTGTDEHGQKVQKAAEANKIDPLTHCNSMVPRFVELWKKLQISYNDFIRTTEERHKNSVKHILQSLYEKKLIYKADYKGRYCIPCERFFTDKDLSDNNLCPDCSRPTEEIVETNYFFKMSLYQDWLINYINNNPNFIQPDFRRNETLGFLRKKLDDLCISRPKKRLSWGIELPFDPDYVCYVWFDALINYISAIGYPHDPAKFAKYWPATCHLIGKDILTTHSVYWPIMLKALDLPIPQSIFAHGWWLSGESKMSKSRGNVVNPMDMIDKYGIDSFRYFLMAEMVLGSDASFTENSFVNRYNSDLANDLGNLVSRVLKMIAKNSNSTIPAPADFSEDDKKLAEHCLTAASHIKITVDEMKLDKGIFSILTAVRFANKYFEDNAPWKLAKQNNTQRLNTVLYCGAEALRIISGLLHPIIPQKSCEIRKALGIPEEEINLKNLSQWGLLKPGTNISDIPPLFPRIEIKDSTPTPIEQKTNLLENIITIEDFSKVKLKTAKVLSAEKVEKSDKLLKLQIQIGEETRQIVAGIAQFYSPEQMIGKTIIVVANLKPAKIKGIESNGMLLAAKINNQLKIVTTDSDIPSGADVS